MRDGPMGPWRGNSYAYANVYAKEVGERMKGYIIMECHWVRHGVNREKPRATPVGENAAIRLIQVTTSPLTQSISITITAL